MLKVKQVSDMYNMRVYTDVGDYFGDIEEGILQTNRIFGWRVKATKMSFLSKVLGGAKGVIVPHQMVKAVGDVMIINRAAIPSYDEKEDQAAMSEE